MTQILRPVSALRDRLDPVYTDRFELPHDRHNPAHPDGPHATANSFLTGLIDVFSVMVHETDGSTARNRARRWVNDYRRPTGSGGGPQLAIWPDGTVMSLVELPYRTTHGNFLNHKSIGVESGHGNDGRYGDEDSAPDLRVGQAPRSGWRELSANPEDVVGATSAKYYRLDAPLTGVPNFESEVVVAAWSTANYVTPAREPPGPLHAGQYNTLIAHHGTPPPVPTLMLFPEAQYRSWALLGRYLAETLLVPRNFPVLPHTRRDFVTADIFKKIVLADQKFEQIVAGLRGPYLGINLAFVATDFTDPAQSASLRTHFGRLGTTATPPVAPEVAAGQIAAAIGYNNSALNVAWLRLFDFYRGFHGHGFSGNSLAGQDDHDCPGPMFDWHRFAREVWDWWWYPFDFDAAHTTTAVADREYRRATGTTPLVEYFFYDTATDLATPDPYLARTAAPGGIQGAASSPLTFRLDERAPVYALANGELVAARFPTGGDVSMAFVLTRHEVWHTRDRRGVDRSAGTVAGPDAANGGPPDLGRIDYNVDPATAYSLHMHLGRPEGMSFEQVSDRNPDWLNRVLIRKKECDIALPATAGGNLAPSLAAVPVADFTQPPGGVRRPSLPDSWRMDQRRYGAFLSALAAGDVAVAPYQRAADQYGPTPMRVILGDFLGTAGVIRRQGGVSTFGVRVEIFSTTNIDATYFTAITDQTGWNVPAGIAHPVLRYASEWMHTPSDAEAAALTAIGVDPHLVSWWAEVQLVQTYDVRTPAAVRLPLFGNVFHYSPLDFMRWINDVTWTSEWPKYRIAGARPAQPRARRV